MEDHKSRPSSNPKPPAADLRRCARHVSTGYRPTPDATDDRHRDLPGDGARGDALDAPTYNAKTLAIKAGLVSEPSFASSFDPFSTRVAPLPLVPAEHLFKRTTGARRSGVRT